MTIQDFPKITVILRGYTYSQVRTVVKSLIGTKLQAVEITMNSPDAVSVIKRINEEFGRFVRVGAGTVITYEEAKAVIDAGAAFVLSPVMLRKEILNLCKEKGVISVPGAFSPTEIKKCFDDGADIVKIFPSGRLGAKYVTDIQAPLGKMPLMVVGGVNAENVREFFSAGASFAGIASGIFNKNDIRNENTEGIKNSIQYFEEKLK